MAARSHSRGWPIEYNGQQWVFSDTGDPDDPRRPCRRCGQLPTPEGHDACLGKLPRTKDACCGHGVSDPYIICK